MPQPAFDAKPKDLFTRLGGQPAIEAVVGEFVARLAADQRVKFRFVNSNIPARTKDLVDFVCVVTGGPCQYGGREMKILHASMHVTREEWAATVEALVGALVKFDVPEAEQAELLGAIDPLEGQIVDPPAERPSGKELAKIEEAAVDLTRYGEQAEIYHNVFSRSAARPFDLGIFKNAQRAVTFDREGIVKVGCNLHANMATSIIVVAAPHYAVTDAKGAFRFRSLAPGAYTLRAWTERTAEPVTRTIEIKEGTNEISIDADGEAPTGTGQDKFGAPRGTPP